MKDNLRKEVKKMLDNVALDNKEAIEDMKQDGGISEVYSAHTIFLQICVEHELINKKTLDKFVDSQMDKYHGTDMTEEQAKEIGMFLKIKSLVKHGVLKFPGDSKHFLDDENKTSVLSVISTEKDILKVRESVYSNLMQKKRADATEEIVKYIMENNHIKVSRHDKEPEFYFYRNGIYEAEGKTYIAEIARDILKGMFSKQLLNDVLVKIESENYVDIDTFINEQNKKNAFLIPVNNGILNLKTKALTDFSPNYIFFSKLQMDYNPDAKCPKILGFFDDILANQDDIKLIIELFGFVLVKEYFLEHSFMFNGCGRNGKGKLMSLLKEFVGSKNHCTVALQDMTGDSPFVYKLHNKLLNVAGDLSEKPLQESGMFKQTCARDSITVNVKYKHPIDFENFAKNIFACNKLPIVYDESEGFWKRWILIDFPHRFHTEEEYNKLNEKDKKLGKILNPNKIKEIVSQEELSGLLNLALDGLNNINKNKCFSYSNSSQEVKQKWIRQSDSFKAFCSEFIIEDFDGKIEKQDIRKYFLAYRLKYRLKPANDKHIKNILELMGAGEERITTNGMQKPHWLGVNFNFDKLEKFLGIKKPSIRPKVLKIIKCEPLIKFQQIFKHLQCSEEELTKVLQKLKKSGLISQESEGQFLII